MLLYNRQRVIFREKYFVKKKLKEYGLIISSQDRINLAFGGEISNKN